MTDIKIPNTLYAVRNASASSNLAYMTPADDRTTKAFAKRKENALNWALRGTKDVPNEQYLDNKPVTGIKLSGWSSRYSTDNKVIRVTDPRDFTVEIPVSNLLDIIAKTTVVHGEIQEALVWGRSGSNHVLVVADSPRYQAAVKQAKAAPIPGNEFNPGDALDKRNSRIYLGKHRVAVRARGVIHARHGWGTRTEPQYSSWIDVGEFDLHLFASSGNFQSAKTLSRVRIDALKSFPKTIERHEQVKSKYEVDDVLQVAADKFIASNEAIRRQAESVADKLIRPTFNYNSVELEYRVINT